MKPLALLRVLGLKVFFPLITTGYQWLVGTNSLKYVMKKNTLTDSHGGLVVERLLHKKCHSATVGLKLCQSMVDKLFRDRNIL